MKLSRGALFVVLIALLILLIGVVQVIARVKCDSFEKESCRPRMSSCGLALAGRPLAEKLI